MNKQKFIKLFKKGLKQINLKLNKEQLNIFWIYMNFLIKENKKYNLTAIKKPENIIYKHFLDSMIVTREIDFKEKPKVIDVGTGAGFPGLVLKILRPKINLVLLDSRLKRIHFLKLLIKNHLEQFNDYFNNIEMIHERAEKLAHRDSYRENFVYVVSRAVAPLNILCEYTLPFLKIGGYAVFYKGAEYNQELQKALSGIQKLGGKLISCPEVDIPKIDGKRHLIVIKKQTVTADDFPRKPGIPKKRPL